MSDTYQIRIGGGVDPSVLNSVNQFKYEVSQLQQTLRKGAELLGVAFGVRELIEFGKRSIEAVTALGRLSKETGIAVENLSKLKYSADISEVGEHFRMGMLKMSETIAKAGDKSSDAARYFNLMGVSLTGIDGKAKTTDQVILDIADKFHGWADGAQKADLAMFGFGTRNAGFISLLNEGSAGLREQGDELERLGGAIKESDVAKAGAFHRSMVSLKAALQGLAVALGSEILPSLTELVKGLTDTGVAGGKLSPVFTVVTESIKFFTMGVIVASGALTDLGSKIGATAAAAWEAAHGRFAGAFGIMKQAALDSNKLYDDTLAKIELLKKPIPGLVKATERGAENKTPAPSMAGDKAAKRDELEQESEAVKLMQDELSLRKEKVKVNFDLTDWEKRDLEVSLLDQEATWLQKQIDLLKQKRALTDDGATRERINKEIFSLTDKQAGIAKEKAGLTGGPGANNVGEQMRAATTQLRQQFGTVAQNIAAGFRDVIGGAVSSVSNGITGLIMRTKTWSQALMEIGNSILTSIVSAVVQMGVKWVATQIMMAAAGKALQAATVASSAPIAAAQAAMWATPATLATISSFGAAAAAAPGFIAASEGAVMATSLASFDTGGYTGNMPRSAVAGMVHGQEFVLNAPATKEYAPILDAMNRRELKLGGASGSSAGGRSGSMKVAFVNDRQDARQFQAQEGWKITADALRKRGVRTV